MLRGGFVSKSRCPRCAGSIYLDSDLYGWFECCLQCGYSHNLKKVPAVKADGGDKYMAETEIRNGRGI
ncbi:MAG TPA: hypothetical protein VLH15_03455 [Dehalococcoidales bacterium]|nr:hypothetical protein [Dehalococcoidales bacterium]